MAHKKSNTNATLLRQWKMLRHIPRLPRKISTAALLEKLRAADFEVDLRTIQRDLNKLSEVLPLTSDQAKPQGWSWKEHADQFDIPGMEPQVALAFQMAEGHLQNVLPKSTLDFLQPWFSTGKNVLDEHGNGLSKWHDKVRVLPRGIPQRAPEIGSEVAAAVYQAVLQEKQLKVTYVANTEIPEPREYIIHPLALVVRDRVIYLVSIFEGYTDPRQLALHRIRQAEILEASCQRLEGFSVDAYIAEGDFNMLYSRKSIRLEAEFLKHVAIHLQESPISDDQTIEATDGEHVLLKATVPDSLELRFWLRSFGDEVEIIHPLNLRTEFANSASTMARNYDR